MSLDVRAAVFPGDIPGIAALDTAFTTSRVYDVTVSGDRIELAPRDLDRPLTKRFPLDDLESPDRPYDTAWVAVEDGTIIGFAAASHASWNHRLVLWHLYVSPAQRGRGVARALLQSVEAHALALEARHIWLETSSLNVPGIAAYRALGFSLSGVDLTLYDGTLAEGEIALFFSRPVAA
jgi:ribosomal protein S18 acetylase RimI-like enzyme